MLCATFGSPLSHNHTTLQSAWFSFFKCIYRWGTRYGSDLRMDDTLARGLVDSYPNPTPMGITAENLAKKFKISRAECDDWALETQKRWHKGMIPFFSLICMIRKVDQGEA